MVLDSYLVSHIDSHLKVISYKPKALMLAILICTTSDHPYHLRLSTAQVCFTYVCSAIPFGYIAILLNLGREERNQEPKALQNLFSCLFYLKIK